MHWRYATEILQEKCYKKNITTEMLQEKCYKRKVTILKTEVLQKKYYKTNVTRNKQTEAIHVHPGTNVG